MLPCYHIYEIVSAIVAEEPYWIQQEPKGLGDDARATVAYNFLQ